MDNKNIDDLENFIKSNYNKNKLHPIKRKRTIVILINILSISCLVAGGFGLKSITEYNKEVKDTSNLQNKLVNLSPIIIKVENENNIKETNDVSINFDKLIATNSDTIGWLKVNNTTVNIPIVQAKDNNYYLKYNFEKKKSTLGWVFADYRNDFENLDRNTVIYGHTYNGTLMFSTLNKTLNKSWLNNKDNHIIEFSTLNKQMKWQIYSIYTISKTNDYIETKFKNVNGFIDFINLSKERSIYNFNTDVLETDKILTLSTCYMSSRNRLVIHAKLITE